MERRLPCPRCAEQVLDTAVCCFKCNADLLVDVRVGQAIADPTIAYALAKELCTRIPSLRFGDVRAGLQDTGVPLLRGATQSQAAVACELLRARAIDSAIRKRAPASPLGRFKPGLMLALAATAVALVGYAVVRPRAEATAAVAPRAAHPPKAVAESRPPALTAREIAARIVGASATVFCGEREGSGFFVAPDRLVTNHHVCDGTVLATIVLDDKRKLFGKVVRSVEALDASLLEVAGSGVNPLPLGDATTLDRGDPVFVIGAPLDLTFTMTQGIVSHPRRHHEGLSYVQIDLRINHGNSGGPLVNERGEVVGLVTLGSDAGIGLALAIDYLYTGSQPLLAAPRYARVAWEKERFDAKEEHDHQRRDLLAAAGKPILFDARLSADAYSFGFVFVGKEPPTSLRIDIRHFRGPRCQNLDTPITSWSLEFGQTRALLPPKIATWTDHPDAEAPVYIGRAELARSRCNPTQVGGAEVLLHDGLNGYDQVVLAY